MPETIYGFEVNSGVEDNLYSKTRIKNGDAEAGLVDWDFVDTDVVLGGIAPTSAKVFNLHTLNGKMTQIVKISGVQAPDYKVKGVYLPDDKISDLRTQVLNNCRMIAKYATGNDDVHIIPVMEPISYRPEGEDTDATG